MKEISLIELEDFNFTLFESIKKRKSVRDYKNLPMSLKEITYLLWSAKSVPSAGALYPLRFYLFSKNVIDLDFGFYKFDYNTNVLIKNFEDNIVEDIFKAAFYQDCIKKASILIFIAANFNVTIYKYKERGIRYVYIEAGHSSQNIYLMSTALNLGTVAIGAFNDFKVKKILKLPNEVEPLYIMPVGKI